MEITSLMPQFGGFIFTLIAFVAALAVIVAVHEFGHYIVGRWSGIHAEVFSLGFGPVLWSRMDKRGTRWQVAAIPFGGFVKFLGDSDAASGKDSEAMEKAAADPAELRRTMHGAPLWARAATVAAGPGFNFIMSILVFAAIFMSRGVLSEPVAVGELRDLPGGFHELRKGDEIVAIERLTVPPYDDSAAWDIFQDQLPVKETLEYTVRRDGAETDVTGPYLYPPYILVVAPRSAAMDIELSPGDVILSIDGDPIYAWDQLKDRVEASNGRVLLLQVQRGDQVMDFALAPRRTDEPKPEGGFRTEWRIGIGGGMAFEPAKETANPLDALVGGVRQTWGIIEGSLSSLRHIIAGQISTCNLSGPIGIAQASGDVASQGAGSFIAFIALLSTAVGLINLFPIPVLDGGHLLFYAYEAVTGRPPSDRALKVLMALGISVILTMMLFTIGNDLFC